MATKTKTAARKNAAANKPAKSVPHKAPAPIKGKARPEKAAPEKKKLPTPVKAKAPEPVKAAEPAAKPASIEPPKTPAVAAPRPRTTGESVSLIDGHKPKAKTDGPARPRAAILPP